METLENLCLLKLKFGRVKLFQTIVLHGFKLEMFHFTFGIPASSFNMIGQRLGRLVYQSEASTEDGNLSLDQVGIICQQQTQVEGRLWIENGGHKFMIGFREIDHCWAPDFINNPNRNFLENFRPSATPAKLISLTKYSLDSDPTSVTQTPPSSHTVPMHEGAQIYFLKVH